jgi:diguanylate cyclase (GGDEF)-like protein
MLGRALGRIQPENTVIMIDLDHFKAVNDNLGHAEGDRVLSVLGHTLTAAVRATDRVGRYGGEEFVVILAAEGADPFLNRLQAEWTRARPHQVTFSAGVAPARPAPGRALEAADRAMYRAKQSGRDQWQWAVEEDYR